MADLVAPNRSDVVIVERKPGVERERWGPGPWQSEPDVVTWKYQGIACMVNRNDHLGTLNGYVGLPAGHPWHGLGMNSLEPDVHGGLTFASEGHGDGLWWLGFDTGHAFDYFPGLSRMPSSDTSGYRDIGYVMLEVESLARQALEAKPVLESGQ